MNSPIFEQTIWFKKSANSLEKGHRNPCSEIGDLVLFRTVNKRAIDDEAISTLRAEGYLVTIDEIVGPRRDIPLFSLYMTCQEIRSCPKCPPLYLKTYSRCTRQPRLS